MGRKMKDGGQREKTPSMVLAPRLHNAALEESQHGSWMVRINRKKDSYLASSTERTYQLQVLLNFKFDPSYPRSIVHHINEYSIEVGVLLERHLFSINERERVLLIQ